ncbi:MAG: protease [Candidatus Muproteobacteria bacterium RBG_16_65_31]|uniref:Protease n=1 Tax=Candidatus Muproteobacteria bacterium RBG_16_65_31 TaxID=1817759 RepID=A0A1F6TIQ1_9PROT|nr:MAG: protease [Candidatus Muproteobacteria bacterium RBG_16_65_31]
MKVLIISADRFEDTELLVPYYRLREDGMEVDIASLRRGPIRGKHGYEVEADLAVDAVRPEQYDALVLPGGGAPATLREDKTVLAVVHHFFDTGKPVAAICHGPQILISAGLLRGRTATCYKTVVAELKAAGAHYKDAEVVVDGNLITSRQPSDLPAFLGATLRAIRAQTKPSQAAMLGEDAGAVEF